MLRKHSGWAWRSATALLFFAFFNPSLLHAGLFYWIPPKQPPVIITPKITGTIGISGYVYLDITAPTGARNSYDPGISGVVLQLTGGNLALTATTDSSGYYRFPLTATSLTTGSSYSIHELQPAAYVSRTDNVGGFQNSSGGAIALSGSQASWLGSASSADTFSGIYLPPASIFGTTSYQAVNYNFGEVQATRPSPMPPPSPNGIFSRPLFSPSVPAVPSNTGGGTILPAPSISTSLALRGASNRILIGPSNAGTLNLGGTVTNSAAAGSSALNWNATPAAGFGLSVNPPSGSNLAPLSSVTYNGTISGNGLTNNGTQTVSVTVGGSAVSGGAQVLSKTASVSVDYVASRPIDSVSTANFGRILQGATTDPVAVTVVSSGSHDQFTDLTMKQASNVAAVSGNFNLSNPSAVAFNGTTTQATPTVTASFGTNGPATGNASFASTLFTGESLASGGVQSLPNLNVPYAATVLAPRQMSTSVTISGSPSNTLFVDGSASQGPGTGLLIGALLPLPAGAFTLQTSGGSDTTTMVNVGGTSLSNELNSTGTGPAAALIATQTLINGSSTGVDIPVTVGLFDKGQPDPGFGGLGISTVTAQLKAATAEAASVKDTTVYNAGTVTIQAFGMGAAVTGGPDGLGNQQFGAPLSATIQANSKLVPTISGSTASSLSSYVFASGTAGSSSTAYSQGNTATIGTGSVTSGNYTGAIGSQADILASTRLATSATVSMAWRNRNDYENASTLSKSLGGPNTPPVTEIPTNLPPGIKWLLSDVVNVQGIPQGVSYAMQMGYSDDLNVALDGESAALDSTYLAKLDATNTWGNAGTGAGHPESLADFLNANLSKNDGADMLPTLDQLVGSWGVDTLSHTSWAIMTAGVDGGGTFAVVPEPATWALMLAGAAGLLAYRARKHRKAGIANS